MGLTRRSLLAGLAASIPVAAEARLATAIRPLARPAELPAGPVAVRTVSQAPGLEAILSRYGLANASGFVLRDLQTGAVIESHRPRALLPPASVSKVVTTLYGLHALGVDYRFRTEVAIGGPVVDGMVQGDLFLIGGGDPHLDTDGLADLAEQVAKAGIRGVTGNAWVVAAALPYQPSIDPDQPVHVGYNPAISGLNLNFNRVHFEWKAAAGDYELAMTARAMRFDPASHVARMEVVDRGAPVFDYHAEGDLDIWSVSRRALGDSGARWLPVRVPEIYAADIFQTLARHFGVVLPQMRRAPRLPSGLTRVATVESAAFGPMARAMLRYSTNLTAEVAGLRAHQALGGQPDGIADSAAAMTHWLKARYGLGGAEFLNHSGLTDRTRITADEMVQVLDIAATGPLGGLLRDHPLRDDQGRSNVFGNCKVVAKTGTLDFCVALAGYLEGQNGKRFAFAIMAADMEARARAPQGVESPPGSRRWIGAARTQERELLARWAKLYAM